MDYQKRLRYIYSFIPKTNMENFPGEYGIKRVKLMLEQLDNPQEKIKVIHIAGTSGKGSTSTIIASILTAHGLKTGLHVKPHLYDIRERFQINEKLISEAAFEAYCDRFFQHVDTVNNVGYGKLTYYEVLISLAYFIFAEEKVDYAVVETGVGGIYDGSNVVTNPNKVCVLTSIGFDHTAILGNTLEEIAFQKAGIMQKGNKVIALEQTAEINNVFIAEAKKKEAELEFIKKDEHFYSVTGDILETVFSFKYHNLELKDLQIGLHGAYQAENAALALAACAYIGMRDELPLKEEIIRGVLKKITMPGRFDLRTVHGKKLILDGAHNPQKMTAFISNLKQYLPNRKFTFLLGFKKGKDIEAMVDIIVPLAKKIYVTDFFHNEADFVSISADMEELSTMLTQKKAVDFELIYNASDVLEQLIDKVEDDTLVVTGSLYMLSDVYKAMRKLES